MKLPLITASISPAFPSKKENSVQFSFSVTINTAWKGYRRNSPSVEEIFSE